MMQYRDCLLYRHHESVPTVQALGLTRGEQLQVANLKPSAPVEVHLVSPSASARSPLCS